MHIILITFSLIISIEPVSFKIHHAGPTGLRLINFLNPPFFCSGALDSGENEGGI
jgi:hypothetical protein